MRQTPAVRSGDATKVLVVDDEPNILAGVVAELESEGFTVVSARNGTEALNLTRAERPDIVVLDIRLPDINGLDVMARIRQEWNVPVILLTARGGRLERIEGLDLGADDYIVKPFNFGELAARVRAVLRRQRQPQERPAVVQAGQLTLDFARGLATTSSGEQVHFTRMEWLLLERLAQDAGDVVKNEDLLTSVWGADYKDETAYLRVWIARLRKKIESDPEKPSTIRTHHGIGYVLETPHARP